MTARDPSLPLVGKIAVVTRATQGFGEAVARAFATAGAAGRVRCNRDKHRIRVNGLDIGWMATPGEDAVQRRSHATDCWLEEAARSRPFGRLIDPAEVARACLYLASSESGLLTGATIDFDQTVVGVSDASLPLDD